MLWVFILKSNGCIYQLIRSRCEYDLNVNVAVRRLHAGRTDKAGRCAVRRGMEGGDVAIEACFRLMMAV